MIKLNEMGKINKKEGVFGRKRDGSGADGKEAYNGDLKAGRGTMGDTKEMTEVVQG